MGELQMYLVGFAVIACGGGLMLWLRLPRGSRRHGGLVHCQVCGRALSFQRVRECLRARDLTYPFKDMAGVRQEVTVRWLCGGCMERAARRRTKEETQETSGSRA